MKNPKNTKFLANSPQMCGMAFLAAAFALQLGAQCGDEFSRLAAGFDFLQERIEPARDLLVRVRGGGVRGYGVLVHVTGLPGCPIWYTLNSTGIALTTAIHSQVYFRCASSILSVARSTAKM